MRLQNNKRASQADDEEIAGWRRAQKIKGSPRRAPSSDPDPPRSPRWNLDTQAQELISSEYDERPTQGHRIQKQEWLVAW
jgi:hypothetical protein